MQRSQHAPVALSWNLLCVAHQPPTFSSFPVTSTLWIFEQSHKNASKTLRTPSSACHFNIAVGGDFREFIKHTFFLRIVA